MKINQLKELSGTVIPEITLKITDGYERKIGESSNGAWSLQNLIGTDETGKIRISIWNREPISMDFIGKTIRLVSFKNKKGLLSGVKVDASEKDGKKYINLNVSKNAEIFFDGKIFGEANSFEEKPVGIIKTENIYVPVSQEKITPETEVARYGAFYKICLSESEKLGMKGEDLRQVASCFFIQGIRDGLHRKLEVSPAPKPQPKVEENEMATEDIPF